MSQTDPISSSATRAIVRAAPWSKRLRWRAEYLAARLVFGLFKALPIDAASGLGSALVRCVGPRLRAHKVARRNLEKIFPEMDRAEQDKILKGMWDNLGRTFAELPHIAAITNPASGRVVLEGIEHLIAARDDHQGGLFVSGHFANWELAPWVAFQNTGLVSHPFFRAPNNPLMADLFLKLRLGSGGEPLPKGRHGAKRSVALLRQGEHLALLVDQKMNDGIEVPFLGHPAMTAPAVATFALKFGLPVYAIHAVRLKGARFRMIAEGPLPKPSTGDRQSDELALMTEINDLLGTWLRAAPEQWLWVHRRWK